MELVRFATIYLPKGADPRWARIRSADGPVAIEAHRGTSTDATQLLLVARTSLLEPISLDDERRLRVPDRERRQLDSTIERLACVAAIANHAQLRLSSPYPFVAFVPGDPGATDRTTLESAVHIAPSGSALQSFEQVVGLEDALKVLDDRSDGAALLADVIGNTHPTGRFLCTMKLFERAFARSPERLRVPLAEFLATGKFGYTQGEVDAWIALRPFAVHADRREGIALESDLRGPSLRMEQAAYDILLNKQEWRSSSTLRRNLWAPSVGTSSVGLDAFITRGCEAKLQFQVFDPFGVWPMDFGADVGPHIATLVPGAVVVEPFPTSRADPPPTRSDATDPSSEPDA